MKTAIECIPCLINQGIRTSENSNISDENREAMIKDILSMLSKETFSNSTPPHLAKNIYNIIGHYLKNVDPYKDIKAEYNDLILDMEIGLEKIIDNAINSLDTAIKLAVTGNIIDFGTNQVITDKLIYEKINEVELADFALDSRKALYKKLETANSLLYLGDNCGEIVFDKLLIKEIKKHYPNVKITFVVRGRFIINDVTINDALQVSMHKEVNVINNGDSAPGTIIENCSKQFVSEFYNSDVVISKGQGNYETLNDIDRNEVFFLFMTKCPLISNELNVDMFSLICKKR